ncbi:ATP-binding cassette sub- A member 5 [Rhizoclosmatium hyalinum]|nr:ATP-binding cassette sub- A member 5 [Rhizoclosmatium hyalinum]
MNTKTVTALLLKNLHVKKRRWIAEGCSGIIAPIALSIMLLNVTTSVLTGLPPSSSKVYDPTKLEVYFPTGLPYGNLVVVDNTLTSATGNPSSRVTALVTALNLPADAVVYQQSKNATNTFCGKSANQCVGAIIFDSAPNSAVSRGSWSYTVLVDTYVNAQARKWADGSPSPYKVEAYLQAAVDSAILSILPTKPGGNRQLLVREVESAVPKLPVLKPFRDYFSIVLFIMCFGPASQLLLFGIVTEKQDRLKESLWMMGVTFTEYTLSWFATALVESIIVWIIVGCCTKILILSSASIVEIIALFVFTGLSLLSFTFILETFFSNARTGPSLGLLVLITVAGSVGALTSALTLSTGALWTLCALFTPATYWVGICILVQGEVPAAALNDKSGGITLVVVFIFLILQFIAYLIFAWYLGQVIPQPFGSPRSIFFLFNGSYWRHKTQTIPLGGDNIQEGVIVEPLRSNAEVGISIRNLSKIFLHPRTGIRQTAVKNLSLDVHVGSVLGLLGRNGAGKTTIISMLTGILPPTSGDASVGNSSIFAMNSRDRGKLGVCPQQDTIFATLTVRETLTLYAKIKNVSNENMVNEVTEIMESIGLAEKANYLAGSLSGGQKRRLSVGIAFIGGSKIVILDEMSSGVDPVSRRELWKIVQKFKSKRTILLTTHFLDEAEALSDRIAILGEGQLKCVGSSLFLKKEFGIGYTLVIVVPGGLATTYLQGIKMIVTEFVPDAEVVSVAGGEIQFRLSPYHSSQFGNLIRELEACKRFVQSYNLTVTTLDEVFLRLSMGENATKRKLMNGITEVIGLPTAEAEYAIISNKSLNAIPPILNVTTVSVQQVIVASVGDNQDLTCAVSNLATNLYLSQNAPGTHVNLTLHRLVGVPQVNWNFDPILNLVFMLQFIGYAIPGLLASNNLVRERTSNAKFQQFISGVRPSAYWTAQFLVDGAIVLVTAAISTMIFVLAKTTNFNESFIWLFLIIASYGLASTNVGYIASNFARYPSSLITMVLVFFGAVGFFVYLNIMAVLLLVTNQSIQSSAVFYINLILPILNPCAGLINALFAYTNTLNFRCSDDFSSMFSLAGKVAIPVGILFGQTVVFFLIAVFMDVNSFGRGNTGGNGEDRVHNDADIDVANEDAASCAQHIERDNGGLVLKRLNKQYGDTVAVRGLSFMVPKGTCFALLGSNGCGKTSTFNMLCGLFAPTSGQAYVNGWGLTENMSKVHESLGVCPQFDALQEYLTVREVITFYGSVKGIRSDVLPAVVDELIMKLDLEPHASKLIAHLSGGNKRKTSVAVALIGNPPVILLDEPSTGMDILSKRHMWDITTHSMEEAEAISNRLAIMSRGQLKCIGSMGHLRNKFSSGISIDMQLADDKDDIKQFGFDIEEIMMGQDLHVSLKIHEGVEMADLFDRCEMLKQGGFLLEYRIAPASLEQIFLDVINEAERDYRPPEDLTGLPGVESWNKKYSGRKALWINILFVVFGFGWMACGFTAILSFASIVTVAFSPASTRGLRHVLLIVTPFNKTTWDQIKVNEAAKRENENGLTLFWRIWCTAAWIIIGFPMTLIHLGLAALSCVSLVGIPFAPMHVRLAVHCMNRYSWL